MNRLQLVAFFALILTSVSALSGGFHYCSGKVTHLVTRASVEGTQLKLEGMNGWARLNFDGANQSAMQDRQFAMVLAAYMSGEKVQLEFLDNSLNCTDDHNGIPVRFVQFIPE